jgi:methylmalonyl-CoA mutase
LPSLDKIRTAVRDGATLPAITSSLQNEESPIAPLPRVRVAEEIETIRLRTEAYAEDHDGPPQVLLAPMGPPTARSARATFARNFLGVAGVAIEEPLQFESADEAAAAAVDHDADIVVLCSSNDEYPDLTPALSAALDDRGHESLLGIAGSPNDIDVDQADFFVHQDSLLQETLTTLQERLGIDVTSDP